MTLALELTPELEKHLLQRAEQQKLSTEEVAVRILEEALVPSPSLEEIVAYIKATPVSPGNVIPATRSLSEIGLKADTNPNFDLATWQAEWQVAEAEIEAMNQANDLAEQGF